LGREDWYRRTTWTPDDEAAFRARLKRSRDPFHKVQYLRIQAGYLYGSRLYDAALMLLEEASRYPEQIGERTLLLEQKAACLARLGRGEEVHAAFRAAFASLTAQPGHHSYVGLSWFNHGWTAADNGVRLEIVEALTYDVNKASMLTPGLAFQLAMAFVCVNEDCGGSREELALWARRALDAAAAEKSGLRKHPSLDLVPPLPAETLARLRGLALLN
jgi:hypothetical protein